MTRVITLADVKALPKIQTYLTKGNEYLGRIGYTDHGVRHANVVSSVASQILHDLGHAERLCELAAIAGYLHDIGNVISREDHGQTGAMIAMQVLEKFEMPYHEVATVIAAIGNHEEQYGQVVNDVGAALILADKSDVHRSRVRNRDFATFDIHDRVNYAAQHSVVTVTRDEDITAITLDILIDTKISQVMEYFEIFLSRMVMCRRAAAHLDARFQLVINGNRLL